MQVPGLPNHKPQSQEIPQAPRQVTSADPSSLGAPAPRMRTQSESTHTKSADMMRLAAEMSRIPEVRPERVAQAQQRLASGYYLSRAAAEATAEQLLRNPE